tara:strand:- start:314 stop:862 length:549 start_codon:yes stop_codon:yes gene_type:complete
MEIEEFVGLSKGVWRSMRSGHSLAFKQFEQIISKITISTLDKDDEEVLALLESKYDLGETYKAPFKVEWKVEEDWDTDDESLSKEGFSILIPFPKDTNSGYLLRSTGYIEPRQSLSEYIFLNDGTFKLQTNYEKTIAEERIWFLSKNVRCRSSVVYTENKIGVIQTSYSSELKLWANKDENN